MTIDVRRTAREFAQELQDLMDSVLPIPEACLFRIAEFRHIADSKRVRSTTIIGGILVLMSDSSIQHFG